MCDEWMKPVKLPISIDLFHQLPRNAAYKYEYFKGLAWLSPRPKYYHALLNLEPLAAAPLEGACTRSVLRPVQPDDWERLVPVFAGAFRTLPPFSGLEDDARREAARKGLEYTRHGGDGPLIEAASFVAREHENGGHPIGAALVTLVPPGDLTDWDTFHWREPPPADAVARHLGRPHLTWIFVGAFHKGQGVGTALLNAVAAALRILGYNELASTFLMGNESSMLWHWRNGFRLLAYPGSWRRMAQRTGLPR
jgi:GNAT superfamily N-acetyltransferase